MRQLPVALRAMSHIPTPDNERSQASGERDLVGAGQRPPRDRCAAVRAAGPAARHRLRRATAALCAMDLAGITAAVCDEPT